MVLQRSPARPRIWGYADNVGDEIVVEIVDVETVRTTAVMGKFLCGDKAFKKFVNL
jgi:hypothetical protein